MDQASALKARGTEAFKKRDYATAADLYRQAAFALPEETADPDMKALKVVCLSNCAQAYLNLKDFGRAKQTAGLATMYDGEHLKSHYRAALAHIGLSETEDSGTELECAVERLETVLRLSAPDSDSAKDAQKQLDRMQIKRAQFAQAFCKQAIDVMPQLRALVSGRVSCPSLTESAPYLAACAATKTLAPFAYGTPSQAGGRYAYRPEIPAGVVQLPMEVLGTAWSFAAGDTHTLVWTEEGGAESTIDFRFYDMLSVIDHYETAQTKAGPTDKGFCTVAADVTDNREPGLDNNLLWSVGLMWSGCGTCGIAKWDEQLNALARSAEEGRSEGAPAPQQSPAAEQPSCAAGSKAAVIWLHGLGDSGAGWADLEDQLGPQFPHVSWRFPDAPHARVSCNGGAKMPSWFDLYCIPIGLESEEAVQDFRAAVGRVHDLIRSTISAVGCAPARVVVGGFSQGGALATQAVLSYPETLGGAVNFSGWLVEKDEIEEQISPANHTTPLLWCHGGSDGTVQTVCQTCGVQQLQAMGVTVEAHTYRGLGHGSCPQETDDLRRWLAQRLP